VLQPAWIGTPSGPEHFFQVGEGLPGLPVEIADAYNVALLINGRLARNKQELVHPVSLRQPERLVGIGVDFDLGYVHSKYIDNDGLNTCFEYPYV
jgi:hypothetical protein